MTDQLPALYVALLHEGMHDKQGKIVTTSLTLIDIHDLARSSRTYGVRRLFIAHPSAALRKLGRTVTDHWREGFGATYNPKRKEAVSGVDIAESLDEVLLQIEQYEGRMPLIVGTSAQGDASRTTYAALRQDLAASPERPVLLLFGTGWGMAPDLLSRCDAILEPIYGPLPYNHLSVRSACAIILDRLCGRRSE